MKIATLQFNPHLGQVEHNISRANEILESSTNSPSIDVDILVLPELAFSGYNFRSLEDIRPYLEPTTAGRTTQWAIETARRLKCHVIVGYPEASDKTVHNSQTQKPPSHSHPTATTNPESDDGQTRNYNSMVVVGPDGRVLRNYRKSFLYYTDETWAHEGFNSTGSNPLDDPSLEYEPFFCGALGDLTSVGLGICMDINPYRFSKPWNDFEFANRMLRTRARLVVLSMAWITRLLPDEMAVDPDKPDMETVAYWLERFHPFVDQAPDAEIIVVFANRCGSEGHGLTPQHGEGASLGIEEGDRVCYAGSSCVMRFQGGNVRMFEKRTNEVAVLGKGEEGLLFVDTSKPARFLLLQRPA